MTLLKHALKFVGRHQIYYPGNIKICGKCKNENEIDFN